MYSRSLTEYVSNLGLLALVMAFFLIVVALWNWTPVAAVAFVAALIVAGTVYERRWQARHGRR